VEHLLTTFEAYLVEAHRLKIAYADQITLLVGAETELVDLAGLDKLASQLEKHRTKIEYLVGSVHHCHSIPIDFDEATFNLALAATSAPDAQPDAQFAALFDAYFDSQLTLLEHLRPEVVGHFDLVRLYHPALDFRAYPAAWAKAERNIRFAVGYGALFEVNASAFRKGWATAYPGNEVFDRIVELGGRFTLSDDSHGPLAVGGNYDRAYEYLAAKGVEELWSLAPAAPGSEESSRGTVKVKVQGKPWLHAWPELIVQRAAKR